MISRRMPSPSRYSRWQDWARDVANVFESPSDQPVEPTVVLLQHRMGNESAAVDGLIMFDPTLGAPVYSHDGDWHPFTT